MANDSEKWRRFGEAFGRGLAEAIETCMAPLAAAIREHYAAKYGKCRVCDVPLGGPAPEQICEPCHVGEIIAAALSDGSNDSRPRGEA